MATWNPEDLEKIIKADDLRVSPLRGDGVTHGTPTWIWCVAVDGSLFVRGYNGLKSTWYQAAMAQGAGRISAAGQRVDVVFEPAEPGLTGAIDAAYRDKYRGSPYLEAMVGNRARAATARISPRDA